MRRVRKTRNGTLNLPRILAKLLPSVLWSNVLCLRLVFRRMVTSYVDPSPAWPVKHWQTWSWIVLVVDKWAIEGCSWGTCVSWFPFKLHSQELTQLPPWLAVERTIENSQQAGLGTLCSLHSQHSACRAHSVLRPGENGLHMWNASRLWADSLGRNRCWGEPRGIPGRWGRPWVIYQIKTVTSFLCLWVVIDEY